ncbi:helix-turn-helix domain-containing protein [Sphingobacterium faecium]|uniref:helix-turn-helix domain-containing protein n=1 Tax=Sphingobacterium faecium TaxID=34087 RepID=UPI00129247CC|nr:helix-turn-helix domain-containing protein [Sphingobacterium faecium]MQP26773.1 helix-turn-helix domain-containing protein [Sphingobacterium faecium]
MLKTFYFTIPQVDLFSRYKHDFQPLYPDTTTVRYETDKIQLTDTYLDYHSVLIYRMEAYVSESCNLPLKTEKSDFHLLYTMSAPRPIIIQNRDNEDQITLPSSSGTYIYVPKGKYDIHVHHGHYDVFGLLIDVGFIRADIFSSSSFLHEFRAARQRDKKKLYQTPIWPIKEMTRFQIQRLEEIFFHYQPDHEYEVIKIMYTLFEIAKQKQFRMYSYVDPSEDLARRVRIAIADQVNQEFSNLSLSSLSLRFNLSHKRLIAVHKQYFKQTLLQYLHHLLILKAKEKLTLHTVSETAMYCGYSEVSSFSDFFFKQVGMRPSTYQRKILKRKKRSEEQ